MRRQFSVRKMGTTSDAETERLKAHARRVVLAQRRATLQAATLQAHGERMAAIETTVKELKRVANDISAALPADVRSEFRERVNEALDHGNHGERFFGALLDGVWRARGAPNLAMRVYKCREQLFGDIYGHHA